MNYDPVEVVIGRLIHFFRLKDWQYDIEECVEDIAEGLKHIGAAKVYAEKATTLTVTDNMARLPKDLQHIKELVPSCPYRESGSFLEIPSAEDGTEVVLHYQAMPVDARGYILVPDAVEVREALVWYMAKILILQKEITHISLGYADQEWHWRCGQARAALNVWSVEQAWKAYQNFVRLNPTKDAHYNNYQLAGGANTLNREKNLTDYRTN